MDVKTFFTRPYTSQDTILTKVYKEVLIDSQKSSDECDVKLMLKVIKKIRRVLIAFSLVEVYNL
jgi:hypothetical protein